MITREAFGSRAWREMVSLRHEVLRSPLGLSFSAADLAAEAGQIHLALWQNSMLAGTLLLIAPDPDGGASLRQMAIRPGFEGHGLGRLLVAKGEDELVEAGIRTVRLSARLTAVGFYARLGYVPDGEPFIEKTLPHRLMRKTLGRPPTS